MARGVEQPGADTARLPFNVDAEAALVGALLVDNRVLDHVMPVVRSEHFFDPLHGRLFDAVTHMVVEKDMVANPVTLRPMFESDEALNERGGVKYLLKMSETGAALVGARDLARQIYDLAVLRELTRLGKTITENALDTRGDVDPQQQIEDAETALYNVAHSEKQESEINASLSDAIGSAIAQIDEIKENDGKVGVTTGIAAFDDVTGGLKQKNLVVIGARPGMGKTAIMASAALGIVKQNIGALIVSLEMGADEIGGRMLSDLCFDGAGGIPYAAITNGRVTPDERERLDETHRMIEKWPLSIIDTGSMKINRLAMGIRRMKRRHAARGIDLKVVFVDYLQLLQPNESGLKAYEAVSQVSRALKSIAKDTDVAMVALAQLNRGVEQRDDKRPMLSDLRDSGQIEQDADTVAFLYREEYYMQKAAPPKGDDAWRDAQASLAAVRGHLEIIGAKRRGGVETRATAMFHTEYQAVRSMER